MKFVLPIEGKTAEELHQLNSQGAGGFYPIGANSAYHGGLHFEGNHAVVAIADGTLIAYRYTNKYLEETIENKTLKYSNSFMLIRHEFQTPKGQKLVFYSHYNHLCPWGEFNERQRGRVLPFVTKRYGITTDTLHIRKGPSTSAPKVPNKVLKKGHAVVASPVDENWARIDGTSEYFHFKDYTTEEQILTPQLDQIVSCDIPLKAGALLGYTGLCEAEGAPAGYTTVHVEVFAGNDAEEFLKNPKQDGKPTQFLIAEGAPLFHRDSKYPNLSAIPRLARAAGNSVKVTHQSPTGEWVQVGDTRVVATVDRNWLAWNTQTKRYTANAEHLDNVRQAFQSAASGVTVDAQSQFELVAKLDGAVPQRTIALAVQESDAAQYWVKRSWLDGQQRFTADHSDCLADNPAAPLFSRTAGTVAYESVVDGRHAETDLDGNTAWYKVNPCGVEGWISDDHVKKCSPYDWPGFKVAKEDEPDKMLATVFPLTSTARDRRVDYDKLPSFFKKLFDEIDTEAESKGVITPREMKAALKKPAVAYKLSRLICYHQSEWCADEMTTSYWQAILDSIGQARADNLMARVKNMCWWNTVSSRTRGFPSRSVYHWHPIGFVEQMNAMNQEPDWMVVAKREIGVTETSGAKSNPRIVEYHSTTSLRAESDDVSWCSSFVNWVLEQSGIVGTKSAWAKDWIAWKGGRVISKPVYGAICVIDYSYMNKKGGHVGFVVGQGGGYVWLFGGNQGGSAHNGGTVKVSKYRTAGFERYHTYLVPTEYTVGQEELGPYQGEADEGSYATTR